MANTKVKDLVVKLREYTDVQGNKKAVWHNIGSVMRGDDGSEFLMIDRHFNPAGLPNPDNRSNVLVSMFDANRDKGGAAGGGNGEHEAPRRQRSDTDDEIPF